jgi:hypothetical protein
VVVVAVPEVDLALEEMELLQAVVVQVVPTVAEMPLEVLEVLHIEDFLEAVPKADSVTLVVVLAH